MNEIDTPNSVTFTAEHGPYVAQVERGMLLEFGVGHGVGS